MSTSMQTHTHANKKRKYNTMFKKTFKVWVHVYYSFNFYICLKFFIS